MFNPVQNLKRLLKCTILVKDEISFRLQKADSKESAFFLNCLWYTVCILRPVKLCEFWLAATLPNRPSSSAYPIRVWSSSFGSIWLRLAQPKFTQLDRAQYKKVQNIVIGSFILRFLGLILVGCFSFGATRIDDRLKAPAILYLTWMHDPSTTMTVQWHSKDIDSISQVSYRKVGESDWQVKEGVFNALPKTKVLRSTQLSWMG